MFIDPPSPFAPVGEWKKFLANMEAITPRPDEKADVERHIELAKAEIKKKGG